MVSVCVQPLDVLRTRMQADAAAGRLQSTVKTLKAVLEAQGARYVFFPLSFFLSLLLFFPPRKRDPSRSRPTPPSLSFFTNRGLWAGSGPTVMRLSAGLAIQFLAIDSLKDFVATRAAKRRQLEEDGGRAPSSSRGRWAARRRSAPPAPSAAAEKPALTAGEAFLVGGGARTLSSALTSPLTLVKTRMEFAGSGGASTVQALAAIARAEGARGLLRGLGPTVAANAPFSALYYSFYSRLRVRFADAGAPAAASNFGAGLLAAAAATVLTQPADMVRTHMQLGLGGLGGGGAGAALGGAAGAALGGAAGAAAATGAVSSSSAAAAAAASSSSLGPWQTLSAVVRERGPGALLAGTAPRILKRTLQTALVWTLYEELQPRFATAASGAGGAIKKGIAAAKENLAGSDGSDTEKGGSKSRRTAQASVAAFDVR
jgi:solute carrier family 25 protein 38